MIKAVTPTHEKQTFSLTTLHKDIVRSFKKAPSLNFYLLFSMGLLTSPVYLQAEELEDAEQEENTVLDNYVVRDTTATRKEESVMDVPISVGTMSDVEIETTNIDTTNQLGHYFPGVQIEPVGGTEQAKIWIRGSGSIDFAANTTPTVGVYTDDVYMPNTFQHTAPIYDLERIEVLRGPQGTRYGRNVTGGLIKYVTAKPSQYTSGYVDVGYGSYNERKLEAALTGAVTDSINMRGALKYVADDGWFENRATDAGGFGFPGTESADLNNEDLLAGRAMADWIFSDKGHVLFTVHGERRRLDGIGLQYVGVVDPNTFTPTCDPRRRGDCTDFLGYSDPDGNGERGDTTKGDVDMFGPIKTDAFGLYATLEYAFSAFDFTSVSATDYFDRNSLYDADGGAYALSNNFYNMDFNTYSQEFRISSKADSNITWDAGVYYSQDNLDADNHYVFFGLDTFQTISQDQETASVFGNIKVPVTDIVSVFGGLRYTYDNVEFNSYSIRPDALNFAPGDIDGSSSDQTFTNISGEIGFDVQVAEDTMVYAKYSKGYKSGGAGAGFGDPGEFSEYDPEDLRAYETGLKTTFLDGMATFSTALYYYDYRNIHVFDVTNNEFGGQSFIVTNADRGIYKGGEADLFIAFTPETQGHFGVSFIDAEYTDFTSTNGEDLSGNKVPFAPDLKFVAGLTQWADISLFPEGQSVLWLNASYTDDVFHDVRNDPLLSAESYWMFDANITTMSADERYSVSLAMNNLTDEEYRVQSYDYTDFGSVTHVPNKPRTFTLSFKYKFD